MSKEIVFYGAGKYAKDNWVELRKKYNPLCFSDRDPQKWGKEYLGLEILSPIEAKQKYGNVKWLVTLQNGAWGKRLEAIDDLINKYGITKYGIENYVNYYYGKGCPYTQSTLFFQHDRIQNCCENPVFPNVPFANYSSRDNEQIIDNIYELKKRTLDRIKGLKEIDDSVENGSALYRIQNGSWLYDPCSLENESIDIMCKHCQYVYEGYFTLEEFEIHSMQISSNSDSRCNFKCPYCCEAMPGYVPTKKRDVTNGIIQILQKLRSSSGAVRLVDHPSICISFGEPALHPDLERIIESVPDAFWQVLTNASVYSEVIQKAIGNGEIVMSLDSGTKETFKHIKGVDCFDQVKQNLLKYRNYGPVIPKYIIIEGVNDNDADVDGFVDFCKQIDPPRVEIVRDYLVDGFDYNHFNWSENTMRCTAKLFKLLYDAGLNVVPVVFPTDFKEELMKYL